MGLGSAISSAISGLRVTQSNLSLISANIANAETPGYVKKTATQVSSASGSITIGVKLSSVNRELDQFLQRQLRVESSGGAYATLRSDFFQRLQGVLGQPGANNALESVFNDFVSAAQTLSTSPDSSAARYSLLTAGQTIAQHLNGMTQDIQGLRSDAELAISDAVNQANSAMRSIASINQQLGLSNVNDATTATLRDQRDYYIDQLAQLMDIKVVATDHAQLQVFTKAGAQLVGDQAAQMVFDAKGALSASSVWSVDRSKRSVGTILLDTGSGAGTDMIAGEMFGSGKIGALIEMRDHVLVDAQAQLDQIASAIASTLSNQKKAGTAVTNGAQSGFSVDIGSVLAGNTIDLTYTETPGGAQHKIKVVRVDNPNLLPLPNPSAPGSGDRTIGVNFSGGMAAVVAQLNSALGPTGLQFSNPSGNTLQVLDDGASNTIDVSAFSATSTMTSFASGSGSLPFFLDGNAPFTGEITGLGNQSLGFAGRIAVNDALLADPSKLVVYQSGTPAGDQTRPNFILDRLTTGVMDFDPKAGVGTRAAPFSGSLQSYIRQVISQQGEAAATADSLRQGQEIVVNSLQQRFADLSNVNIDQEMANLLKLQTAYGANARVLTTVKEMFDMLLRL